MARGSAASNKTTPRSGLKSALERPRQTFCTSLNCFNCWAANSKIWHWSCHSHQVHHWIVRYWMLQAGATPFRVILLLPHPHLCLLPSGSRLSLHSSPFISRQLLHSWADLCLFDPLFPPSYKLFQFSYFTPHSPFLPFKHVSLPNAITRASQETTGPSLERLRKATPCGAANGRERRTVGGIPKGIIAHPQIYDLVTDAFSDIVRNTSRIEALLQFKGLIL